MAVHCSWADAQLSSDPIIFSHLPSDAINAILKSSGDAYLENLATASLNSECTDRILKLYEPLIPELTARWTNSGQSKSLSEDVNILACLARFFPFARHLRPRIRSFLHQSQLQSVLYNPPFLSPTSISDADTATLLLALFRLLSTDPSNLRDEVKPTFLSSFLSHGSLPVRYLAIQCLCIVMHFADALSEKMVERHVGADRIEGLWEGKMIDFHLLKLFEEKRWKDLDRDIDEIRQQVADSSHVAELKFGDTDLLPQTASIGGILLPRNADLKTSKTSFVETVTAKQNLQAMGSALLRSRPVLVTGMAGSGKTSIITESARLLNKQSSMITLHLNEQTDAKSLLGIYTSSTTGDSFTWQPGVLTKAIQQGRWVLIEDIDRAPSEVLGMLRPVIENGELFLPSRKETLRPSEGFRLLATIKTSSRAESSHQSRHAWLSSDRLWSTVKTENYEVNEIQDLLSIKYPQLRSLSTAIIDAHEGVCAVYRDDPRFRAVQSRQPSLRDLLKWCRRISHRLERELDSIQGGIPETMKLDIFRDAIDCYAALHSNTDLLSEIAARLAQAMNISPQQMKHALSNRALDITDRKSTVAFGRSLLKKVEKRRPVTAKKSTFAMTNTATRIISSIATSTSYSEPLLLVGETGVGKTTIVQHIASLVNQTLTVINLSQQSEASDLLGGLKPITTRSLIIPLLDQFNTLFDDTFSNKRNEKFQLAITKAFAKQNWQRLLLLWQEAVQMARNSLKKPVEVSMADKEMQSVKRRKVTTKYTILNDRWTEFSSKLNQVRSQVERGDKNHTFAFVEGRLVQAVRGGEWLLLDEINLASADTLDNIISLLHNGDDESPSILLTEAGNIEQIKAHPDFRVFAAMNPATDAGKKDLAPGLRSRFTELYVAAGDSDIDDLVTIIETYLATALSSDRRAATDLANSYLALKKLNEQHKLTDGAGDIPHFSIRSLVRCLQYVIQHSPSHGLRRSMHEGFAMSFFTVLSRESENLVLPLLDKYLLSNIKNPRSFLSQQPKLPFDNNAFVAFRHHLVVRGPESPDLQPHYIRTPSVERNLINLARASSMRRFPILLQGPTSAGKTSMVEYLAKLSGNRFVRINNHEHTDLQEYLGSYATGDDGKLEFREGVLVEALRKGHWIVLDELNLAPSDVLEALNRLLDDNRELLIPETQEVVKPHQNFMLFATQNPAGLYGGRKRLSRAFRNRFLELHFDDIPEDELEVILRERAQIAPSYCTQIVQVYKRLSLQRQSTRLFEQRNSFATLRDLFRWAARPADSREQLAQQGFMLLGERCRDHTETMVVKSTIEETMKCKIDPKEIYGSQVVPASVLEGSGIVWTSAMRRLFVLVSAALQNNEPVLLVGETGCGKTQICQTIAQIFGRSLSIYNAHSNTETGDLIGSQRPIRQRSELANAVIESFNEMSDNQYVEKDIDLLIDSFEEMDTSGLDPQVVAQTRKNIGAYKSLFAWNDGSLVRAMRAGEHFLLDEISLADDSVLERLNSVLEPSRTILLAEKGTDDNFVIATPGFQFLATMNPGGDYGKRELSAALRNRLTEIWVPSLSQHDDILPILRAKLGSDKNGLAIAMVDFATWFRDNMQHSATSTIPLRSLLTWADFVNKNGGLGLEVAFVHGAAMVYIDSLGANPAGLTSIANDDVDKSRVLCLSKLQTLVEVDVFALYREVPTMQVDQEAFHIGSFRLSRTPNGKDTSELVFDAATTLRNTMRIVRALQIYRPILLEGSPGVGKTAIVTALAAIVGKPLTRINLSDQTDLMDLFGADVPSHGEDIGHFSWRDGPLLQAMQTGGWVLLDEMNLASQSVLEGLNSCLDHRHEVYIAELDKSFVCHPDFTLFAAQNPHHQGGGRKGLPASFVNRFTIVYADPFEREDLSCICRKRRPNVPADSLEAIVDTVAGGHEIVTKSSEFNVGGPWELNLRDVNRWLDLCEDQPTLSVYHHYETIISQRFRGNKAKASSLTFWQHGNTQDSQPTLSYNLSPALFQCGTAFLARDTLVQPVSSLDTIRVLDLSYARSVVTAINKRWPIILAGPSGSGKTRLIRSIAALNGAKLVEFSMNADVDIMDLIGGFEQYDARRDLLSIQADFCGKLVGLIQQTVISGSQGATQLSVLNLLYQETSSDQISLAQLDAASKRVTMAFPGEFDSIRTRLQALTSTTDQTGSHFVWNDGILIDAIQNGSWIVLDNANLCNPSVLDRLNSLLEPNGTLVVSEQHNSDQDERVIEPHKDFRIFLTMDPRYGELSRAMRNRSLELYMDTVENIPSNGHLPCYPTSANINRLRLLVDASENSSMGNDSTSMKPFLEGISYTDFTRVERDLKYLLDRSPTQDGIMKVVQQWQGCPEHVRRAAMDQYENIFANQGVVGFPSSLLRDDHNSIFGSQPQVPAINDALLSLSAVSTTSIEQHARLTLASLDCVSIKQTLESIGTAAKQTKLDQMSVLQKSLVLSDRGSRRQQQELVPAANLLRLFIAYISDATCQEQMVYDTILIDEMISLARDFITFFNDIELNNAVLQAYIQTMRDLLAKSSGSMSAVLREALALFKAQHSLNFGLSLQMMWPEWSPVVASNDQQLQTQLAMEDLLARFDDLAVTLPHPRRALAQIRSQLVSVCSTAVTDTDSTGTVAVFNRAVDELAVHTRRSKGQSGHFSYVFDWLFRTLALKRAFRDNTECQLFSLLAHNTSIMHTTENNSLRLLALYNQQGSVDNGATIQSSIDAGKVLIASLADVKKEPLSAYKYVVEETRELANALCSHAIDIEYEASQAVPKLSADLVWSILHCHRDLLTENVRVHIDSANSFREWSISTADEMVRDASTEGSYFKEISETHLLPAISWLASSSFGQPIENIGRTLVNVSVAALKLLVPDRVFDPAIYPALVKQRYNLRASRLRGKIAAYRNFQMRFTGEGSSMLVRLFESDLQAMGDVPQATVVVRPAKSELHLVQEEFSNVVRGILQGQQVSQLASSTRLISADAGNLVSASTAVQQIVRRLVERLSKVNRAYDDIVKPVIWLLECLDLGSKLISQGLEENLNSVHRAKDSPAAKTPLLGALPTDIFSVWPLPAHGQRYSSDQLSQLRHLNLIKMMENKNENSNSVVITSFLDLADHMYDEWRTNLSKDQVAAEARSRYYAYRGEDEATEDEVNEEMASLFPTFESDSEVPDVTRLSQYDARSTSIMIAKMHKQLLTESANPQAITDYVLQKLDTYHSSTGRSSNADSRLTDLLPGIILQLEKTSNSMDTNDSRSALNIYTDTDIVEVQRLLAIMSEVQVRFEEITTQWPDHAVPIEVLDYADELLSFQIDEPIAKLLTKTEKLLDIIAQWQSVASREWSVTNLMESLTSLIISWRKLELSSWSRLLDIEQRKNEEDASAWYFIAYEAVIYNSRLVVEQTKDVTNYCQELASTLEEFLKTTIIGQFGFRLHLLQVFRNTLEVVGGQDKRLLRIVACVSSVLNHFKRYEAHVQQVLSTGRAELEKNIKEQIQLASWKDTNPASLRESARRSHHKLFKIVRKYRALLSQPMTIFKAHETKDEILLSNGNTLSEPTTQTQKLQHAALLCADNLHGWKSRPDRLTDPVGAVASMRRIYLHKSGLDVATELASFREDISSTAKELRKQTPQTLTEDNTPAVRHLRERKRRLLAETMKTLSHVGVRRNLGTNELGAQSSTSVILANSPDLSSPIIQRTETVNAANDAFHEILDFMPHSRLAAKEHSDDLTDGEVMRGLGLLEGLLAIGIAQRASLNKTTEDLQSLSLYIGISKNLQAIPEHSLVHFAPGDDAQREWLVRCTAWLPQLLRLSCRVLGFQAKSASLDITDLISSLQSFADKLEIQNTQLISHVKLPSHMSSSQYVSILADCESSIEALKATLEHWQTKEPSISYIIRQIVPWTQTILPTNIYANGVLRYGIPDLDNDSRRMLDQIFVAIQRVVAVQTGTPDTSEDQGWLVKNDKVFIDTIRSLHVGDINIAVKAIIDRIHCLKPNELPLARAIIDISMPVLEQYYGIAEHLYHKQLATHLEMCRLGVLLSRSYTSLTKEGFCTPSDPSKGQEQSGKLESGTGLGEGEGAEDISKDIGADEDLSELAQAAEQDGKDEKEVENSKDAVDMGADDLEGEMGSGDEQVSGDEDEHDDSDSDGEDQIDEETGSVDELDPSAVDEKMWDDAKKDAEKDEKEMKSEKQKGQKTDDQTAKEDEAKMDGDEKAEEPDEVPEGEATDAEDEAEGEGRPEAENVDPHLQEEQALDLPEDIQFDADEVKDDGISDDGMDDMSDVEQYDVGEPEQVDQIEDADTAEQKDGENDENSDDNDENNQEEDGQAQDDEVMEDQPDEGEEKEGFETREDDIQYDIDDNEGGDTGTAKQLHDELQADQNRTSEGQNDTEQIVDEQQTQSGQGSDQEQKGDAAQGATERGAGREDDMRQKQDDALQKLADVLEQFHQRREILTASEERKQDTTDQDVDMADAEFEHLGDDNKEDAQALGAAAPDQAQNLDQSKAIEDRGADLDQDLPMPEDTEMEDKQEQTESIVERFSRLQAQPLSQQEGDSKAKQTDQNTERREQRSIEDADVLEEDIDDTKSSDVAHEQGMSPPTSISDAAALWADCSKRTHTLSLLLTEQLRLILAPTTATKLRGDFRTGKRLNIKRIIPYIASGYKRDKIWMRRSIPSKRNYQIMIAVDDSKSMSESGADLLAFETLAMLSKSLTMLEAGDLCVVSFGQEEHIRVAHPFGQPFTSTESGMQTFRNFGFNQQGTDVRKLVRESISLFQDARLRSSSTGNQADIWQLQLIISDGHCSDHDTVRRLVRAAHEQKIMIVFVIVDAGKDSIVDLKEAVFERMDPFDLKSDMTVKTKRYLEGFPFQYYVVVREVSDLPAMLARVLKGWFESVVDV